MRQATCLCLLCLLGCLVVAPCPARAQDIFQEYRNQIRRQIKAGELFAPIFSGVINVTVSPEISSSNLTIDEDPQDVEVSITKLPIYHYFDLENHSFRPYAGLTLGYMEAESKDVVPITEKYTAMADVTWTGYSLLLEGGVEMPVEKGFFLSPSLCLGTAQLRKKAVYLNEFSRQIIRPLFEGIIYNFYVDALIYAGCVDVIYRTSLNSLQAQFLVQYSHTWMESYESSDPAQDFKAETDTIVSRLELNGPLGLKLGPHELGWQYFLEHSAFLGPQADALGFDQFFESGLTLSMDITSWELPISKVSLGGSLIYGENIEGWSLILGYNF